VLGHRRAGGAPLAYPAVLTLFTLTPANARRLMEAVARDKSGEAAVVKTMEELEALAGE
jgi:hypothetical protein